MLCKKIRLGRDSEVKATQQGKQLLSFAGAYDVGFGQNKRTQWIDCAYWGDRGVAIQQYMLKGKEVVIYADDVELEQFTKGDGSMGAKLKCRIVSVEFTSGGQSSPQQATPAQQAYTPQAAPQQAAPAQQAAPQQAPAPAPVPGYEDFDDDIPF